MGNVHLVTGYAAQLHIAADDHGSMNSALFGGGEFALNKGSAFSALPESNNKVIVHDGDLIMQGRHVRLREGSTVDVTIENGTQNYKRNDIIVCRYTKDATTGIEDCNIAVIKGRQTTGIPSDPDITTGDISLGAEINEMPLYRVKLNGINISLEKMFDTRDDVYTEIMNARDYASEKKSEANSYTDSRFAKLQSGVATISYYPSKSGSVTVLFPAAYTSKPTVVTSQVFDEYNIIVKQEDIYNDRFVARITEFGSGTTQGTRQFSWIAYGA